MASGSVRGSAIGSAEEPDDWKEQRWDLVVDDDIIMICDMYILQCLIEGSLEVKLPTIWTDEKQSREKRKIKREKSRRERVRKKKEDGDARKGRKVAKHCVFSNDLWLRGVEK